MTTHLEESLQRDFDRIQALLTRMAGCGVRMLQDCVRAYDRADRQLASLIILRDQQIDHLEKEIDRLCLEFLVRHQPAGAHLRFAYAALQINFELERIGDYAESIARQVLKVIDLGCRVQNGLLSEIAAASISMLHNAVVAFVRGDRELAEATARTEEQVDLLRNQANSELMHLVQSNRLPLAALTPLMTIARRFERVSDQAKSICQETLYICTGEYLKHAGDCCYRVLFVDERHGSLSQMARAIGQGLGRADFEFASAGLAPAPLPREAAEFLREKGLNVSGGGEHRVLDLPGFDRYHLVIAFSPEASKGLPAPSRKTVQLEWPIEDPCLAGGPADQVRFGMERAYNAISEKLSEMIHQLAADSEPSNTP
jgi:phosphate transport system protein